MKKNAFKEQFWVNLFGGFIVGVIALACVVPFLLVVSGSFSEETQIVTKGYSLFPRGFSLDAYKTVFADGADIFYGYRNTIIYTIIGTSLSLFVSSMTGYVLSRKYFEWRNYFAFFFYFTTLFSGGLVPSYLWHIELGMKNNPLVLILTLSMFHILLMRNFISSVPDAIAESAKMDGANEFVIFTRLILPLTKPALATVGLFLGLQFWNSWYDCMLYITKPELQTLQYNLYKILNQANAIRDLLDKGVQIGNDMIPPAETVKLAMTVVTTGPILLLYPFIQKYFVKGLTVGAVKG